MQLRKQAVLASKTGRFRTRNGPFRAAIWAVLEHKTVLERIYYGFCNKTITVEALSHHRKKHYRKAGLRHEKRKDNRMMTIRKQSFSSRIMTHNYYSWQKGQH